MAKPVADPATRFWEKVNKDGPVPLHRPELGPCWVWTASLNSQHVGKSTRYGQYFIRKVGPAGHRRSVLIAAHRFSWTLEHGELTADAWVLHRCDNGRCVRPSHLFLGDHASNMADMKAKGRAPKTHPLQRGELSTAHKLSEGDVREVRRLLTEGVSYNRLVRRFGVAKSTIYAIAKRRTWAWL